MVKSVVGSLPTYYMSIFKAPQGILEELERIRRSFIWGNEDTKKKIHWVEWSKVIAWMKDGGLGVGSIKGSKWWWRLVNEENSLWKKDQMLKFSFGIYSSLNVLKAAS